MATSPLVCACASVLGVWRGWGSEATDGAVHRKKGAKLSAGLNVFSGTRPGQSCHTHHKEMFREGVLSMCLIFIGSLGVF